MSLSQMNANNATFRGDWLLKFLYRTANVKLKVAGLAPVQWENRRMHNIDLTDVVCAFINYHNEPKYSNRQVWAEIHSCLAPGGPCGGVVKTANL